jgi:hypothetical protein
MKLRLRYILIVFLLLSLLIYLSLSQKSKVYETEIRVTKKLSPRGLPTVQQDSELRTTPLNGVAFMPTLKRISKHTDQIIKAQSPEKLPYEFRGGDSGGRVIDSNGRTIMESGKEVEIFGIALSPDKKSILVEGRNTINYVVTPSTQKKIKLPIKPVGVDMLGMGPWYWINSHMLLGESGRGKVDKDGKFLGSDDNVAESNLYIFNISKKSFDKVQLPFDFRDKVFGIVEVDLDGYIKLHFTNNLSPEKDPNELGWFKIEISDN